MSKRCGGIVAGLVVAAIATGIIAPSAVAQTARQKLSICMGPGAFFYVVHYVAEGGGYFSGEGLDTETTEVNSGPAQVAAIMGGSVDVGPLGLQLVVQATQRGGDMVALSTGYNNFPITLTLSNDAVKRTGIADGMAI